MSVLSQKVPEPAAVLAKALLNAAEQLGLKQTELGAILVLNRTGISRLKQNPSLDPNSKKGELALLVIRIARALFALTGGDREWIKHFMHNSNKVTGGTPAKQMETIQGLIQVMQFVDAIRGKV